MNKRKLNKKFDYRLILALGGLLVLAIGAIVVYCIKYTPSKETMALTDYFVLEDNQTATIVNGKYLKPAEDEPYNAVLVDSYVYLNVNFVKKNIDDNYVLDSSNGILRYTNSYATTSVSEGDSFYTLAGKKKKTDYVVLKKVNGYYYMCAPFMVKCTDATFTYTPDPNRIQVQLAGVETTTATLRSNTQFRRFGGVKSKILKEGEKGEEVTIVENYGKWSLCLTGDGVLGCVKNTKLKGKKTQTVEKKLKEDKFTHNLMDDKVVLGWHQVTNSVANNTLEDTLSNTKGINVISPTWYQMSSNDGGLISFADDYYVGYCHGKGIQVWGLVSNIEKDVDTSAVLNSAPARDKLIKSLISDATSHNLDGINVDIEQLSASGKDGYMEFIKELSLECKEHDLILSVDNYPPTASSQLYNRKMEGQYCDYVIVMAYDEHWSTSEEEGSNSSLPFVKEAVKNTLEEVDANQVILALPLYTKLWKVTDSGFTCSSMGIKAQNEYIKEHNLKKDWLEKEAQYYAEYTSDGTTYKLWIEDNKSLGEKIGVYSDNKLAGLAFWKLGFENSGVWDTVKSGI